jgi:hypothetical protein
VQLAGLPPLLLLAAHGPLEPLDLLPWLLMPLTWGLVTGLALATWAYEPLGVRRAGEVVGVGMILLYLVVGVLAAERLADWLLGLPEWVGRPVYDLAVAVRLWNPFGVMESWLRRGPEPGFAGRFVALELAALLSCGLLLVRASARLKGHFHDRHYRPVSDRPTEAGSAIGDKPLSWWAVRRVMEYSGRLNIWLAGGFGLVYAAYLLAGPHWPAWLGREVFRLFERAGGVPALTAALAVLAAVPASFQYGLWDPTVQDRCRRLELLLLTRLDGRDYWDAAAAAAWKRGRGYFAVALVLWSAALLAGRYGPAQTLAAVAAGVLLWGFSFALGFRAFARGAQANGLGALLTLGLPSVAVVLTVGGQPLLGALLPPGAVYAALAEAPSAAWLPGPVLAAAATLYLARTALPRCGDDLRRWYDLNHGARSAE